MSENHRPKKDEYRIQTKWHTRISQYNKIVPILEEYECFTTYDN